MEERQVGHRSRSDELTRVRFFVASFSKPRIIPTSALSAPADKVPAALHLPPGKLFFGWTYKPFDPAGGSGTASGSSAPAVRSSPPFLTSSSSRTSFLASADLYLFILPIYSPQPAPFSTLATNGATLSGRAPRTFAPPPPPPLAPAPAPSTSAGSSSTAPRIASDSAAPEAAAPVDPWANLGSGGNTLNGRKAGGGGKSRAEPIEIDSD